MSICTITLELAAIALAVFAATSTVSAQQLGTWAFQEHVDPLEDKVAHIALTVGDINGSLEDKAQIGISCHDGEIYAGARTALLDIGPDRREVKWRTDSNPVVRGHWNSNSGVTGVITWGEPAVEFARAIVSARIRIVVNAGHGTIVFGVEGSTKAVRRVLAECGVE